MAIKYITEEKFEGWSILMKTDDPLHNESIEIIKAIDFGSDMGENLAKRVCKLLNDSEND